MLRLASFKEVQKGKWNMSVLNYMLDEDRGIQMKSKKKPKRPIYSLDELLSQCKKKAPYPIELKEWDRMKPMGSERL